MLLPLSDAPNPRGIPVVTYVLIAVNVVVYGLFTVPLGLQPADINDPSLRSYLEAIRGSLPQGVSLRDVFAQLTAYDLFVFAHGYKPAAPAVSDLLTSLFLHGGFMHLFGNMLFLWIYGDNVEHRLGKLPFLFWYLLTGVAATLAFAVFAGDSMVPLVGASGAISGVLGFYFLWFPRNTVRVFIFLFPLFMNVVAIPARIVLGVYLIVDNMLPFLLSGGSGGGGVAHGAHIGGFVAGLAAAWALTRREVTARPAEFGRASAAPVPASGDGITAAMDRGEMADSARAYFSLGPDRTRRLLPPEDSLRLAEWLAADGHAEAALVLFRRHLRDYPSDTTAARAHLGAGLVQLDDLRQVAPAYQHFLDAIDLAPDAATEATARQALTRIAALQKYRLGRG
ncbi:MAG: rhomboid family intramembrane serine protease [Vicinamibacterales bacterium]|nr:rhomboid family intramembrane serine protease [Vicinamibacterales bacterium]